MSRSCPAAPDQLRKPQHEVADIFAGYGESFRRKYQVSHSQRRIMADIEGCRTVAMGGHTNQCNSCGYTDISYNSCRNRHCPKCQSLNKARWLEARQKELLPVKYFHLVFTVPHELNSLFMSNKRVLLGGLFKTVNNTLREFCRNPRYRFEGQLGYTAVLHTWDQKLGPHYHVHLIVPAGVWRKQTGQWQPARYGFLFPVKAMSIVFRAKLVSYIRRMYTKNMLMFPGKAACYTRPGAFSALLSAVMEKPWVVYAKRPFKSPKFVLDYLGRYTRRVAISNNRITSIENGKVCFTYKQRRRDKSMEIRTCQLDADLFIRRFLMHELPSGFMRIRHFGFLGNACKTVNLEAIRRILNVQTNPGKTSTKSTARLMLDLTGIDITRCPKCELGTLKKVDEFDGIYKKYRWYTPIRKAG